MLNRKSNACGELKQNNRLLETVDLSRSIKQYCSTLHFTDLHWILLLFKVSMKKYHLVVLSKKYHPACVCHQMENLAGEGKDQKNREAHSQEHSSGPFFIQTAEPKENNSCLAALIPASIHARLCPGLQGFLVPALSLLLGALCCML